MFFFSKLANKSHPQSSISSTLRPISAPVPVCKNLSFFNPQTAAPVHYVGMTTTTTAESEARSEADPPLPPLAATKEEKAAASGDAVVIAVKDEEGEENGKGSPRADVGREGEEVEEFEKVCRICHLSPDQATEEGMELIPIGCGCKNELGTAHRNCAETWFRLKGNRCCEICGLNAKNITGEGGNSFIEEWNDNRLPSSSGHRNSSEGVRCWRGQPFCNFLMACLVVAFILPWFFRVNMF